MSNKMNALVASFTAISILITASQATAQINIEKAGRWGYATLTDKITDKLSFHAMLGIGDIAEPETAPAALGISCDQGDPRSFKVVVLDSRKRFSVALQKTQVMIRIDKNPPISQSFDALGKMAIQSDAGLSRSLVDNISKGENLIVRVPLIDGANADYEFKLDGFRQISDRILADCKLAKLNGG